MSTVLLIVHLLTLAAITAGSSAWKSALWSVSWWGFLSLPAFAAAAVLSLIFTAAALRSDTLRDKTPGAREENRLEKYLIPALFIVLMIIFRFRHSMTGGLASLAERVSSGEVYSPGSVIPALLNQLLYRFLGGVLLVSAADSIAALSILAGGIFSVLAFRAGKFIAGDNPGITALLLISGGYTCIFFGGASGISAVVLFSFIHIILSLRFLREGGSPLPSSAFLLLALFSDPTAVFLIPGFLYIVMARVREPENRRAIVPALRFLVLIWAAAEAVLFFLLRESPAAGPIMEMIANSTGGSFRSFLEGAGNGILIVGPAALSALIILIFRSRFRFESSEGEIYSAVNVVAAILLIFSQQHQLEKGIKWNALLAAGPAFYIYTALMLKRACTKRGFRKAALILAAAGLVHLAPIVLVNSSGGRAERQLSALDIEPGKAETIIAGRAFSRRNYEKSEEYYMKAAEKDTTNSRAFFRLGELNLRKENYFSAVSFYGKALRLRPDNPEYRFALAEAYIEAKWYDDAAGQLEILVERFSSNSRYWSRYGYALNHSGKYSEAVKAYRKALSLEPENSEYRENLYSALLNRGAELQNEGKKKEAEDLYRKGISMVSYRWEGYFNLASIYVKEGNYSEAAQILTMAVNNSIMTPDYRVYMNLGFVLEKLGRDEEALKYLKMAEEMNPMAPADQLIDRIREKSDRE